MATKVDMPLNKGEKEIIGWVICVSFDRTQLELWDEFSKVSLKLSRVESN